MSTPGKQLDVFFDFKVIRSCVPNKPEMTEIAVSGSCVYVQACLCKQLRGLDVTQRQLVSTRGSTAGINSNNQPRR